MGPTSADVFHGVSRLSMLPLLVSHESLLRIPCLETVTVLLSVKSTYEPGASSIVQVDLLPKHDPRELKLTTAK